jgi:lysozyme
MQTNKKGIELLKTFEGCKLKTYLCPAGIPTIGYGHTGPDVTEGLVITKRQAESLLKKDLAKFEKGVGELLKVKVSPNQFSALVVFAYNVGLGALAGSTLLKKLNAGDIIGAGNEFLRWNKVNKQEVQGLTNRRNAERDLFLTAEPTSTV